jgi:hypothetical protein
MGSSPKPHHAAAIRDNPQNLRECCKVTIMSLLYGLRNYHALFGRRGVPLALKSRILGRSFRFACVPGLPHPLHLRLRNCDVTLLRSIFLDGEYDWSFLPKRKCLRTLPLGSTTATSQVAARRFIRQQTGLTSAGIVAKQLSLAAKQMVARSHKAWTRTRPGVPD